jgi:hypothetical protein
MAGEVPPLNVEILVSLGNLTTAVNQATEGLNKIGNTAIAQTSKLDMLKTTMLGVFAGNIMTQGAQILEQGLRSAIKAVEDTQVATERLSTALNNANQNTAANRDEIQKTSESMSKLGFSTATTESAYGTLITATGSTTEATKLMAMAADLARYKHEDLATAAATLAKGTTGSAKAFKELGITLDSNLPKNEAIQKAFDQLNQKIGGQAVGYTHTFSGEMEILKAKFDDVAVKVGAVVMPILTKLMEFITNIAIPAIVWITKALFWWEIELVKLWNTNEGFRSAVVDVMKAIVEAIGYVVGAIGKLIEAASHIPIIGSHFKGVADGINNAAKSIGTFAQGLDNLISKKAGVASLSDQLATMGSTSTGGGLGIAGQAATKSTASTSASKTNTIIQQMDAVLVARQEKMAAAQTTYNDAVAAAQTKFNQTELDLQTAHSQKLVDIQQQYADNATQIEQAAADKRQSIIQQSIDLLRSAWESATKINLGSLFTAGDSSATGLQTQLQTQLAQIQKLQEDAGKLAAQGYSQSFIQEVLAQGPQVGDQMAQSVLTAAPDTANSIKTLYDQIQATSQGGLDSLAAQMNSGSKLATKALTDQYAQVSVDMQTQLDKNTAQLTDALGKENQSFNDSLTKAQQTLADALTSAQDSYDKAIQAISDSSMKQLDALDKKLQAVAGSLKALAALAGLGIASASSSIPNGSITSAPLTFTSSNGFSVPNATAQGPGITVNQTNNISNTATPADITTATLNGIVLGQTQGLMTKTPVVSTQR